MPPSSSLLLRNTIRSLQALAFGHLFFTRFYSTGGCSGPSMLPTISTSGDFILISRLHTRGRGIRQGDLISYLRPDQPDVLVCKRVVGLEGDFVLVEPRGPAILEELEELGLIGEGAVGGTMEGVEEARGRCEMVQVPAGHCWVAGDNLDNSRDSRHYGPVPLGLVRGKVVGRIWPRPGWFENGLRRVEEENEFGLD
ncbi:LexA/Signal peptidase [Ascobolus immersus RN42]|uniref:Mitochondrial inner membrane protease subunit n=1 Tax=Ascobolus immersus RN42 TaxID=1160509 RepID=A0A3N4HZU8_ASCIM|nr:LexA/Signal peptidase [Ascobolus immersus RN42]